MATRGIGKSTAEVATTQKKRHDARFPAKNFPDLPLCYCEACIRNGTQCTMPVPVTRPGEAPVACPLCWRHEDQLLTSWSCLCDCAGCEDAQQLPPYLAHKITGGKEEDSHKQSHPILRLGKDYLQWTRVLLQTQTAANPEEKHTQTGRRHHYPKR